MAELTNTMMEQLQQNDGTLIVRFNETIGQMQSLLEGLRLHDLQTADVTRARASANTMREAHEKAVAKASAVRAVRH